MRGKVWPLVITLAAVLTRGVLATAPDSHSACVSLQVGFKISENVVTEMARTLVRDYNEAMEDAESSSFIKFQKHQIKFFSADSRLTMLYPVTVRRDIPDFHQFLAD